jgi:F-box interacting protein
MRCGDHQFVHDCKGLILFTTVNEVGPDDNRFEPLTLWNPAIRMSMTLPRPRINDVPEPKYCIHGFGFDQTSNDYKVLRMFYNNYASSRPTQAELYRLRTGAWETLMVAEDSFQYYFSTKMQAFVNGASHWVVWPMAPGSRKRAVLLFDMFDEEFRVMKLPDHLSLGWGRSINLGVSGGLLSLMENNKPHGGVNLSYSIWLMKEYGVVESWTKQFTIDLEGWRGGRIFLFRNNEKVLAWNRKNERESEESVLYDPKTHRFIKVGGIKGKGYLLGKNTFVDSLVLLDKLNHIQT